MGMRVGPGFYRYVAGRQNAYQVVSGALMSHLSRPLARIVPNALLHGHRPRKGIYYK